MKQKFTVLIEKFVGDKLIVLLRLEDGRIYLTMSNKHNPNDCYFQHFYVDNADYMLNAPISDLFPLT